MQVRNFLCVTLDLPVLLLSYFAAGEKLVNEDGFSCISQNMIVSKLCTEQQPSSAVLVCLNLNKIACIYLSFNGIIEQSIAFRCLL